MSDATRRRFLNWFMASSGGALLASIFYPIVRYVSPPRVPEADTHSVEAGFVNDPELLEKGFKIVRFGADPVILVKPAAGGFRAFAATCTHLDCIVEYRKDRDRIWCNCHNGEYDLSGNVVGGPPPKPLQAYRVDLIAGEGSRPDSIVVSRSMSA